MSKNKNKSEIEIYFYLVDHATSTKFRAKVNFLLLLFYLDFHDFSVWKDFPFYFVGKGLQEAFWEKWEVWKSFEHMETPGTCLNFLNISGI